jgi:hypothetical protein
VAQPGHAKLTGAIIRGILEVWGFADEMLLREAVIIFVMLFGVEIGFFKERMTSLPCFPSPNPSRSSTTTYLP